MLTDAISDLYNEAQRTGQSPEALVTEIAADYGLNPALVLRKFNESHPHGVVSLQAVAKAEALQAAADAQDWARELAAREAIAEFFATTNHGMGRGVTAAARDYLRKVR